jgi:hypothetical protein
MRERLCDGAMVLTISLLGRRGRENSEHRRSPVRMRSFKSSLTMARAVLEYIQQFSCGTEWPAW